MSFGRSAENRTRTASPPAIALIGVPGIEPGLHAPHACVLPVYYTPAQAMAGRHPMDAYCHYTTLRIQFNIKLNFGFMHCLNALNAHFDPFSGSVFCPLQIRIFSFFSGGVILTSQELAGHYHN